MTKIKATSFILFAAIFALSCSAKESGKSVTIIVSESNSYKSVTANLKKFSTKAAKKNKLEVVHKPISALSNPGSLQDTDGIFIGISDQEAAQYEDTLATLKDSSSNFVWILYKGDKAITPSKKIDTISSPTTKKIAYGIGTNQLPDFMKSLVAG